MSVLSVTPPLAKSPQGELKVCGCFGWRRWWGIVVVVAMAMLVVGTKLTTDTYGSHYQPYYQPTSRGRKTSTHLITGVDVVDTCRQVSG